MRMPIFGLCELYVMNKLKFAIIFLLLSIILNALYYFCFKDIFFIQRNDYKINKNKIISSKNKLNGEAIEKKIMSPENEVEIKEKVIYQKIVETKKGENYSNLMIANIDGSEKQILVGDILADFLLVPERNEVIIIDNGNKEIKKLMLKTQERIKIFDFQEYGIKFINKALLFSDKNKLIFSGGVDIFDQPKIMIINLVDSDIQPKIIYDPGYSISLEYWDSVDRIYGYKAVYTDTCKHSYPFLINSNGESLKTTFSIQEFFNFGDVVSLSPNGKYFARVSEHPEGHLTLGMCAGHLLGILRIHFVKNDSILTIELDKSKTFSIRNWTEDSKYLIYKVFSYRTWRASNSSVINDKEEVNLEEIIAYNLDTKEKIKFKSDIEVDNWLKKIYPTFHIVKFSENTYSERPEDKSLYIDGRVVDFVDKLPWGGGPAIFDVLGFIVY